MKNNRSLASMTGYGRGEIVKSEIRFLTEIRSVNHRFFEVVVRLPSGWLSVEEAVRKQVQQIVKRGRVDVFITIEGTVPTPKQVQVDWNLIHTLLEISKQIEEKYGISGKLTVADLLQKTEFWSIEEPVWKTEEYQDWLLQSVILACTELKGMRLREGEHLAKDLMNRVQRLLGFVHLMKMEAPKVAEHVQNRLKNRMQEILEGSEVDLDRLLTEVAIFVERADITEELTRLESHAQQFIKALDAEEPIGRRLDFIIQEMNREVNTIGSKANLQKISALVIEAKSELEKMKEQVQNIE
jgi:uncharacterized protein (TIGR00255 family)